MTRRRDPLERLRGANPVADAIDPDWEQVKQHLRSSLRADRAGAEPARRRHARRRPGRRLLLGLALCACLGAGLLLALAPRSGSPGFLARAAAALAPPSGTVLYERWEKIVAPEAGNRLYGAGATLGPEQLWIEAAAPHRYRVILQPDRDPTSVTGSTFASLADVYGVNVGYVGPGFIPGGAGGGILAHLGSALAGGPLELGGALQAPSGKTPPGMVLPTLTFLPPDRLLSAKLEVALGASLPGPHEETIEDGADPVQALRAALAENRAHLAGPAQLGGRTVQRIDFVLPAHPPADAPPLPADAPSSHADAYAYVEPESLRPVEIVDGGSTYRFLAYEYLPASTANSALTSIRTQHPNAAVVPADAAGASAARSARHAR